jgi:hypothetical protein
MEDRKRLDMTMTTRDVIVEMSEGNPGAINAMMALLQGGGSVLDLLHLDNMGMRGSQIWVAFKDHCEGDVAAFVSAIRERDPDMIATVNENCPEHRAVRSGASYA